MFNRELGRAEGVGKPPSYPAALVCLVVGHHYDSSVFEVEPVPTIYCDRCGREY